MVSLDIDPWLEGRPRAYRPGEHRMGDKRVEWSWTTTSLAKRPGPALGYGPDGAPYVYDVLKYDVKGSHRDRPDVPISLPAAWELIKPSAR